MRSAAAAASRASNVAIMQASGYLAARSATLSGRRTAATTWSPTVSADSANARPKPRDAPVMIR